MSDEKTMGQVIQIDEVRIRNHRAKMVRGTVEETLNAMLDAEADQLMRRRARTSVAEARQDTRAGSYGNGSWRRRRGRSQSQGSKATAPDLQDRNY